MIKQPALWRKAGLAAASAALATGVLRFVILAIGAIRFPYGIDYGEGIVWQQMRMMVAGHAYGPIQSFPAIVFHYPPLYHLASALAAAGTGMDQLAAGRMVSVLATFAAAGMIMMITVALARPQAPRAACWLGGLGAGAAVLATTPMLFWAYLMRVDMLFLAFSLAGVWLGIRALTRPTCIHGAALCFVAAIFTKQTALAAPAAVFAVMMIARPRTAWAGLASGAAMAVIALAVMIYLTDGGFLQHIIFYNINRFSFRQGVILWKGFYAHVGFLIIALWLMIRRLRRLGLGGGVADWVARIRNDSSTAAFFVVIVYFSIATIMLGLVFKSGSSHNYLLEWVSLLSLFTGLALAECIMAPIPPVARSARWFTMIVPWIITLQLLLLLLLVHTDYRARKRDQADLARLTETIRLAPAPVIGDDMVGILQGGKVVLWEPSIFAELASKGVWDERPFLALIRAHRFAFFVTEGHAGDGKVYDARYTPGVNRAITQAYPQIRYLAQYELHFPAGALPAYAAGLPAMPSITYRKHWPR